MTTEKMVYVKSNDYWGYDASEFDTDANFYTYTWTVPESMYNDMDADNQAKLFPCALFYVQGVTDNHNFLTLTIDVDGSNAKVRGMQGAKRRTLKFESGVPYAYSVGSLTMKAAPAGSDSVSSIEDAVKDGSASMAGTFNVSDFLTDASAIASAVGLATATSSAESYASETITDSYPQSSAEIGNEQSGRGVPVAYGSGSSQYVEPPVLEMSAEVTDAYPQSSAEIGEEQSGRGVPVSYGSGSSQYVEPPVLEMSAEVTDSYPQSSAEIGDEQSGRGVPVAYGSGSSQYVEPPVLEMGAEVIDDDYMDVYATQGYNDRMDESLGMRHRGRHTQSMKDRRDEAASMDSRKYDDVETMDSEYEVTEQGLPVIPDSYGTNSALSSGQGVPVWYGSAETFEAPLSTSPSDYIFNRDNRLERDIKREQRNIDNGDYSGDDAMTHRGMVEDWELERRKLNEVHLGAEMEYVELGAYDFPVIPNTVGTDSAGASGYGVPQWYGADTFIDSVAEGAPPAHMGKKIGVVALVGLGLGAWLASRKN